MSFNPASTRLEMISAFSRVGTIFVSNWKPSLGPTSIKVTLTGRFKCISFLFVNFVLFILDARCSILDTRLPCHGVAEGEAWPILDLKKGDAPFGGTRGKDMNKC